ncbi:hypothetical protein PCANC_10667 [Puccinia coronata f. sp. avenae]|uniref:Uncharacterized protein n=1 Tax=Puccinia coronata f. sp. avenae TaxID=200324 RepID=A0A2N5VG33_9BASI|nr:hypothetical protein PCANC_10667 [Puccinia coronata f. sp. avenae]
MAVLHRTPRKTLDVLPAQLHHPDQAFEPQPMATLNHAHNHKQDLAAPCESVLAHPPTRVPPISTMLKPVAFAHPPQPPLSTQKQATLVIHARHSSVTPHPAHQARPPPPTADFHLPPGTDIALSAGPVALVWTFIELSVSKKITRILNTAPALLGDIVNNFMASSQPGMALNATGAAGALASWAFSSVSCRLTSSKLTATDSKMTTTGSPRGNSGTLNSSTLHAQQTPVVPPTNMAQSDLYGLVNAYKTGNEHVAKESKPNL